MKKALFVCYGSGHVRMVVPVARALQEAGLAKVQVLGLTTAAPVVRAARLPLLQIKDFVMPGDEPALARGRELVVAMGAVEDATESAAYLGLCYEELEAEVGVQEAQGRYARLARQAFLPVQLMTRVLQKTLPDLVVVTNSPRAERAAVIAAGRLGIPSVCIVDLFAVDEVRWIGAPDYARRVCVLNEGVKEFLVAAGRQADEVVVTGNPAFDALLDPGNARRGQELRKHHGWEGRRVVLWPSQAEPAVHPFDGRPGDPALPGRVLDRLVQWVQQHDDAVLCVRPRAGDTLPTLPDDSRIVVTGQDWPLPELLHAADAVVTLSSTVGLEGHLCGARLIQVLGSVFEAAMPLARFGVADAAVSLQALDQTLDQWTAAPRRDPPSAGEPATQRVVQVLAEFL